MAKYALAERSSDSVSTVPLCNRKLFIITSFPILVLKTVLPNNKNIQPVHEDSKFRTVNLGRTELGMLRTCARVPRARARAARANESTSLHHYISLMVNGYCSLGHIYIYISVLFSKRGTGSITLIWIRCTLRKSKFQIECVCAGIDR
jgi:hypothetical protein